MYRIWASSVSVLLFAFCAKAQYDTIIHSGMLNVAVLKLDYDDLSFEGGAMYHFDCPQCTNDSIPFNVVYQEPLDFGGICLRMEPSLDTLFNGSIVWLGSGSIHFPTSFSSSMPFAIGNSVIDVPDTIQCLTTQGQPIYSTSWTTVAELCWNSISNLEITESFSNHDFRAAIYLYTPAVGFTDYSVAKWIMFLYYQDGMVNTPMLELNNFICSPNPFSESFQIHNSLTEWDYKIYTSTGEIVKMGVCTNGQIEGLSLFTPGIYFIEVSKEGQRMIRTLIKN